LIYHAKSYNIGFLSDSHNKNDKIDEILSKHPEITEWFHLGDLVSFLNPKSKQNHLTEEWYFKNACKFVGFVQGNHDQVCGKPYLNIRTKKTEFINVTDKFALCLKSHSKNIKIVLPNDHEILLSHSFPNDILEFVQKTITEREFVDEFLIEDNTLAVLIGHNHYQWKKIFVDTDCELCSIGAVLDGHYAILEEGKIQLKKL